MPAKAEKRHPDSFLNFFKNMSILISLVRCMFTEAGE